MPLIDVLCSACDSVLEVYRHNSDWPKTPACETCGGQTEQTHLPRRARTLPDAVVVFQAPDGTFRFPGDPNGSQAENYRKMGYERKEFRGFAEVRKLEGTVNKQQYSEIMRRVERHQEMHERGQHARRSDLYNGMANSFQIPETDEHGVRTGRMKTVKLGAYGRDVARAAVEKNNRRPAARAYEPGFHVEAYSNDRSNREGGRGR